MATIEELTAEVERLRVNLRASEMLRAMECQAVYQAIRQPGEKKPSRISVICSLRGVTLPEDFLPVAERIIIENEELRSKLKSAMPALEAIPWWPHTMKCGRAGNGCDCLASKHADAIAALRAVLEAGNGQQTPQTDGQIAILSAPTGQIPDHS